MTLLAVALDTADAAQAVAWAGALRDDADVMKVGLQLFVSAGPDVVGRVAEASGLPVFLDLKLDDIPNTVAGAARAAASLGIGWLTVHTGAGKAACEAALEAVSGRCQLLGVTLLTSLGAADLKALALATDLEGVIDRRARLAAAVGFDGVVCAGADLATVRQAAPALDAVVPGVRPPGAAGGDQARLITPGEAAAAGAAMIVVGRPITAAADVRAAAAAIRNELKAGHKSGGTVRDVVGSS